MRLSISDCSTSTTIHRLPLSPYAIFTTNTTLHTGYALAVRLMSTLLGEKAIIRVRLCNASTRRSTRVRLRIVDTLTIEPYNLHP